MSDRPRVGALGNREAGHFVERKVSNKVTIAMLLLISSLVTSNVLYHILRADTFIEQLSSNIGITFFMVLVVVAYGAAYYLFRKFISPVNKDLMGSGSTPRYFRLTYNILRFAFVSNAAILTIMIVQIITISGFYVGLTILLMQANAVLTTVIFAYLSFKFLSWYKSNHDLTVLFFAFAFGCVAIAIATSDAAQTIFFLSDDPWRIEAQPHIEKEGQGAGYSQPNNVKSDSLLHNLYVATQFPLRVAFVLYWIATAMLLRKYSKTIGQLRFWTLVSLPLATLIIGSILNYGNFVSQLLQGIILPSSALFGGILFGLIFLTIARALRRTMQHQHYGAQLREGHNGCSRSITRYLTMAVFGTILFLVTNTPSNHILDWVHIPYPPFADVVWSFIGFAAYLYGFGLYFSVISISHDAKLRKSIQKLSIEEANMLHRLGSTQMQQEIQKRVVKLSREQEEVLKEQTGVEQHLTDDEIKQYVKDVMEEIQKAPRK
jgi:hypothetical protein